MEERRGGSEGAYGGGFGEGERWIEVRGVFSVGVWSWGCGSFYEMNLRLDQSVNVAIQHELLFLTCPDVVLLRVVWRRFVRVSSRPFPVDLISDL